MSQDVLVIGAGVAGSVVARRLAQAGVRVALVGGESRPGWEGISRRAVERLQTEGVALALPAAVRCGHWGGRTVDGQEYLIERAQLARRLRALAGAAGVTQHTGRVSERRCVRGRWQVSLAQGPALEAAWLIDARGRRGRALTGPRLLAVSQAFALPADGGESTQVEALQAGWCWWARSGSRLSLQVTGRPRDGHPAGWAQKAAAELPQLACLLRGASAVGLLQARPAHARLATPGTQDTLWRVGDAAYALDPLSGQGVYEALRSAQLVATALTAVLDGSDLALAQQFVRERQQASFHHALSVAGAFYRENQARGSFWTDTAHAYERLAAQVMGTLAGGPRIERRPVLVDGRIVAREVVVTARHPRGVWQVSGVAVAPLLREPGSILANLETTAHRLGKPLQAVRDAVHWLQQSGVASARPRPPLS